MSIRTQIRALRAVIVIIIVALGYLAYTGVQDSKSYYVTIKELNGMGNGAFSNGCAWPVTFSPVDQTPGNSSGVPAGRAGPHPASGYNGSEAPPDTFKDIAGLGGRKIWTRWRLPATNIQAKCASKYAPKQPGNRARLRPQRKCSESRSSGNSRARRASNSRLEASVTEAHT